MVHKQLVRLSSLFCLEDWLKSLNTKATMYLIDNSGGGGSITLRRRKWGIYCPNASGGGGGFTRFCHEFFIFGIMELLNYERDHASCKKERRRKKGNLRNDAPIFGYYPHEFFFSFLFLLLLFICFNFRINKHYRTGSLRVLFNESWD